MKKISIKIDKDLLKDTELISNSLNISRNKYIQDALLAYNRIHKRKLLENQLKKESYLVRNDSMAVLKEFEDIDYEN